ncbi:MAG: polysaccharide biosynthesis tyrosine autokinase, partial [Gemmatimonadales bacterium]|nr:polysaccharide biosynthesis tyrosine autokinase [Gemmatimonadales bacterium]
MNTQLTPLSGNLPSFPAGGGALGAGSPLTGNSGGPRTSPITRYLSTLRRFKWLVLLMALLGLGGGFLVSRMRPETFVVRASMLLAMPVGENGPISAGAVLGGDQWKKFMRSYRSLEPIARAQHLYLIGPKRLGGPPLPYGPSGPDAALLSGLEIGPSYTPGAYEFKITADGKSWELTQLKTSRKSRGVVGDSVGKEFGFAWLPTIVPRWYGKTFEFDAITEREAADDINSRLGVDIDFRGARFVLLTLAGQESEKTAATLNALLKEYETRAAVMKRVNLTAEAGVVDTQLRGAYDRLRNAEQQLLAFTTGSITKPRMELPVTPGLSSTSPQGYTAFIAKREAAEGLRRDRRDLQEALAKAQGGEIAVDLFLTIPSVSSSTELKQVLGDLVARETELRTARAQGYSDDCRACGVTGGTLYNLPELLLRIREIRTQTLPAYAQAVVRRLDGDIARLDGEVANAGKQLQGIPSTTIEENRLKRELEIAEETYKQLTGRSENARLREASALSDLSIYDPAVAPLLPSKNRKSVIIAVGLFAGLAAGLGLAFLLDLTDKRVRYADQITSGLGLTILGVVPEIRRAKGETPSAEEAAQVIEAFRTIRLNLSHTMGEGRGVLTISSPSPGDGKSLVASNLALSFAESGYRTLLIDGDTRRGELHRTFGQERRPGLLDHLTGELDLAQLPRKTSHPMLTLITAGSRKRNGPELLGGVLMRELISSMREAYDVVIVDSPPLGAGIDPFVLGTLTGNMILVMRSGATERDLAEAKLQIVDQLPIRLIGAVLNDVRSSASEYK